MCLCPSVKEARLKEIKSEILNSEKLKVRISFVGRQEQRHGNTHFTRIPVGMDRNIAPPLVKK